MSGGLDHGQLNMPLAKRGNIDAQIDRYKADQVRIKKAEVAARRLQVRETQGAIKKILNLLPETRLLKLAAPLGMRTPTRARAALYQAAKSNLSVWHQALRRELAESGNGCCKMAPCSRRSGPCCDMAGRCAECRARVCEHSPEEWCGEGV